MKNEERAQKDRKYALITGGSSGIGLALAKKFAADGYGLVLAASNETKLLTVKRELEECFAVPVVIYAQNLAQMNAAETLYERLQADGLTVEVLVNNAGIGTIGATETIASEKDKALMVLNMITPVTLTKLFLKEMYARGSGRILNVCSTGAFQPGPYTSTYYASKSFLLSYTKAVRYEAKKRGVVVSALCPGTTKTDFFTRADSETPKGAMSAEAVADYAYKHFLSGKEVIIPGLSYRLMKLFPEKLKTAVIAWIKS